ncbi:MAG: hypothetical protein ABFD64_02940 [Armatimonadota bacterium]
MIAQAMTVPIPKNPVTEYGFGIGGAVLFILLIILVLKMFLKFLNDQRTADQTRMTEEREERSATRDDFLSTYKDMTEQNAKAISKIAVDTSAALAKNTETLDRLCKSIEQCETKNRKTGGKS